MPLRKQELLRVDGADVWRVPKQVVVTTGKSRTRSRRLVGICSKPIKWLAPFRSSQRVPAEICDKLRDLWATAGVTHARSAMGSPTLAQLSPWSSDLQEGHPHLALAMVLVGCGEIADRPGRQAVARSTPLQPQVHQVKRLF
jgi:hypothetical protein